MPLALADGYHEARAESAGAAEKKEETVSADGVLPARSAGGTRTASTSAIPAISARDLQTAAATRGTPIAVGVKISK